jgi:hypothetical protein
MRLITAPLLVAVPLAVASLAGAHAKPAKSQSAAAKPQVIWGKVTRIDRAGNRVEVRPWNASLPKRMWVAVGPDARMLVQRQVGMEAVKPGDRVSVLGTDSPPIPRPPSQEKPEKEGAAPAKPPEPEQPPKTPRASAIFRYPSPDTPIPDRKLYYRSARGFFIGERKGGLNRPAKGAPIVPGVLVTVKPLVVRATDGEHTFQPRDALFVVDHLPTRLDDLDRGESIMARCRLGEKTAQGDPVAELVIVGPDPQQGKTAVRRSILREQRPLQSGKTPKASKKAESDDQDDDEADDDDL